MERKNGNWYTNLCISDGLRMMIFTPENFSITAKYGKLKAVGKEFNKW
jgi:rRNA maturation protein Nop10